MNLIPITETFYVSGQIAPSDLADLKARGFTGVICNRPDGEDPGQPTAAEIQQAAEAAGITFAHVPFDPMNPSPSMVDDFADALTRSGEMTLAYCRSGNRSSRLWAAVAQG